MEQQTEHKMYQKTKDAIAMVQSGINPADALKYVNCKDNISAKQVSVLRAKVKKHSLTAPGIVKSASSQIKRILSGECREIGQQKVTKDGQVVDYTETIAPSDTNILAAASLVYDRYEPVIKQGVQVNVDISAINLDDYRNKLACGLQGETGTNQQVIEMIEDK